MASVSITIPPQAPPVPNVPTIDVGKFEGKTSTLNPKKARNDELHDRASKLLIEIKSNGQQAKDYNTGRREATASLRPVLTEIWQKFEAGETVGGFSGKEAWAKAQGITIRWCQKVIAGPSPKANSVRLDVGKVVKIGDTEYTLTREMLDAIKAAAPISTAERTARPKFMYDVASGPTADKESHQAGNEANKQAPRKNKAGPAPKKTKTEKVLVARIGDTQEFGVFPDSGDGHTASNALTIGTKQACEAERDRLNTKRAVNAGSVSALPGATNTQVPQTAVSVH